MSLTLLIWIALFVGLTIASIRRPSYAVGGYMLSFFLCPPFWWWGDPIGAYRWNLYSGVILLLVVLLSGIPRVGALQQSSQRVFQICGLMAINATVVNYLLSADLEISTEGFQLLVKFLLLGYLIFATIKSNFDLKIVMSSMLLGAAYIGFEVTINERGEIQGNRLEGVGAPGASTANHFASLMVTVLPLVAPFFLVGTLSQRVMAILAAPFILNVVLLCNSRGAFLAAIASAIVFLIAAPKDVRGKAWKLIAVGAIATFMLMGDSRILDRFTTIFASEEDRDTSAQSRIDFAKAGIDMVVDYPLGSGGSAFKKVRGIKYLMGRGLPPVSKAIHNGYITEATQWGVQGAVLRLSLFAWAILATWRTLKRPREAEDPNDSEERFQRIAACSFLSGIAALLVTSCFGDHLDSEWGIWLIMLSVAFVEMSHARTVDAGVEFEVNASALGSSRAAL